MSRKLVTYLTTLMMFLMLLTSSGCFLQPVSKIEKEFNFVDMDAPALRLAAPVKAKLLKKDTDGKG